MFRPLSEAEAEKMSAKELEVYAETAAVECRRSRNDARHMTFLSQSWKFLETAKKRESAAAAAAAAEAVSKTRSSVKANLSAVSQHGLVSADQESRSALSAAQAAFEAECSRADTLAARLERLEAGLKRLPPEYSRLFK